MDVRLASKLATIHPPSPPPFHCSQPSPYTPVSCQQYSTGLGVIEGDSGEGKAVTEAENGKKTKTRLLL